ncbi:MAG TPA: trypsin-like peptidase domain-containing protein [Candidatus Dormibacteraeota bacterium]|nr:trypsin-like peptidase domain-containing protein [Candidatus Dormibacteraeota bacterium]
MVDKNNTQQLGSKTKTESMITNSGSPGRSLTISLPSWRLPKPAWQKLIWTSRVSLVLVLLLGLAAGFFGGWLEARNNQMGLVSGSLSQEKKVVTSQSQLISQIAKLVGPSVVSVNVTGQQTTPSLFGFSQSQQTVAAGTGIIISSDGLIITNRHVVPAGTTSVSVTLSDGTQLKNVTVVGRTNANDSLDIAFLKIQNSNGHKLIPAAIGDSAQVQVGDAVVAIGNALGQFQNTVTSGIISGYGRQVQASDGLTQASENLDDLFQTDAAINEGNSGGPLVNLNGQVIGINTAVAGNAQNIGFAIPINDVKGLINQVLKTGKFVRPFLGVRYIPLTPDVAQSYGLSVSNGAYIAPSVDPTQPSIEPGSPAAKAGLQEGDVISQVNGTNIDQSHSLTTLLNQYSVGDKLRLTILRTGQTLNLSVTLEAAPAG